MRMRMGDACFAPDLLWDVKALGEIYGIRIRIRTDGYRNRIICHIRVRICLY